MFDVFECFELISGPQATAVQINKTAKAGSEINFMMPRSSFFYANPVLFPLKSSFEWLSGAL